MIQALQKETAAALRRMAGEILRELEKSPEHSPPAWEEALPGTWSPEAFALSGSLLRSILRMESAQAQAQPSSQEPEARYDPALPEQREEGLWPPLPGMADAGARFRDMGEAPGQMGPWAFSEEAPAQSRESASALSEHFRRDSRRYDAGFERY